MGSLFMLESARLARPGAADRDEVIALHALAVRYFESDRCSEALPLFEEAARHSQATWGPTHPDTLVAEGNLAATHAVLQQWDTALPLLEAAVRLRTSALGHGHPATLAARDALATAYRLAGQADRAAALHRGVAEERSAAFGPAHHDTLVARLGLAMALFDDGQTEVSARHLSAAVEDAERSAAGLSARLLATLRTHLARCLAALGQRERAVALIGRAAEELAAVAGPHDEDVVEMRNTLRAVGA